MSKENKPKMSAGRPSAKLKAETTLASLKEIGLKRINFDVSRDDHLRLKIYAAREGRSIKDIMTHCVQELLNKQEGKESKHERVNE